MPPVSNSHTALPRCGSARKSSARYCAHTCNARSIYFGARRNRLGARASTNNKMRRRTVSTRRSNAEPNSRVKRSSNDARPNWSNSRGLNRPARSKRGWLSRRVSVRASRQNGTNRQLSCANSSRGRYDPRLREMAVRCWPFPSQGSLNRVLGRQIPQIPARCWPIRSRPLVNLAPAGEAAQLTICRRPANFSRVPARRLRPTPV